MGGGGRKKSFTPHLIAKITSERWLGGEGGTDYLDLARSEHLSVRKGKKGRGMRADRAKEKENKSMWEGGIGGPVSSNCEKGKSWRERSFCGFSQSKKEPLSFDSKKRKDPKSLIDRPREGRGRSFYWESRGLTSSGGGRHFGRGRGGNHDKEGRSGRSWVSRRLRYRKREEAMTFRVPGGSQLGRGRF